MFFLIGLILLSQQLFFLTKKIDKSSRECNLNFYFRYKCPEGYHSIPDIRNFTMAKREQESQEPTIPPTDNNCLNLTGKQGNLGFKINGL